MKPKKTVEELTEEFFATKPPARKLQVDSEGYWILDCTNPADVEWYEDDN